MNTITEKRQNARCKVEIPITFRRFNSAKNHSATLLDCSADGVHFTTRVELSEGSILLLQHIPGTYCPDKQPFLPSIVIAETKRCDSIDEKHQRLYHVGAHFICGDCD